MTESLSKFSQKNTRENFADLAVIPFGCNCQLTFQGRLKYFSSKVRGKSEVQKSLTEKGNKCEGNFHSQLNVSTMSSYLNTKRHLSTKDNTKRHLSTKDFLQKNESQH